MPAWVNQGFLEYQKRIRGRYCLNLVEIPALHRGKNADLGQIKRQEEIKIRELIPLPSRMIALDLRGISWTTEQLTQNMQRWMDHSEKITLVVAGPDGFSDQFLSESSEVWSLSDLTFAHSLVRVILAEQIYRGFSILEGLPYHR